MLALETENQREDRIKKEEEKKEKMVERLEQLKEAKEKKREEEDMKLMEYKQQVWKLKAQKYQHEKLEDHYKQEILLPELKREEKIRNDIKSLHRPIRKEELDDHEWVY